MTKPKRYRKKSRKLGLTRKKRQQKRCDQMIRHKISGRCIEFDGRLARKLYPKKKDRLKALKERPCKGVLHWTNSRWRCIDPYARRQRMKKNITVSRRKTKYNYSKKTKKTNDLFALLSKL